MTFNRYRHYPLYTPKPPTAGIIAASLRNGTLESLVIDDDQATARWVADRTIFSPEVKTYGRVFPFYDNNQGEYGSIFCRFQENYESIGRSRSYTFNTQGGGVVSLTKIAPLYDLSSLLLSASNVASSSAAVSYLAASTNNDWADVTTRDVSIDVYVKAHKAQSAGAELTLAFDDLTNPLGLKVSYSGSQWNITLLFNGSTVVIPVTFALDSWHYIVLNKAKDSGGSSAVSIYLNGVSIYSSSLTTPAVTSYPSFTVQGAGAGFQDSLPSPTSAGTSFMVSNLRVDTNVLKKTFTSYINYDSNMIYGLSFNYLFAHDISARDPHYHDVTMLLKHETSVNNYVNSPDLATLSVDVSGYNRASIVGNAVGSGQTSITGSGSAPRFSTDPNKLLTTTLPGTVVNLGTPLSFDGFNISGYTTAGGVYVPWIRVTERDRSSLTFSDEFTFEFWVMPARGGTYIFNTTGGIALVDGILSGIGADIPVGSFGVTTGLNSWNHVAIARQGASQLRVFINAVEVASVTRSGAITFDGLELGNSPTGDHAKHFTGAFGQIRATKVCRYTAGSQITSQVFQALTRTEFPDGVTTVYDPSTDYVYGIASWYVDGVEAANAELVRLTLFKYDPRGKTIALRRDIWTKTNTSVYPSLYSGVASTSTAPVRSLLSIVNGYVVLARNTSQYEFFSKHDLQSRGVYGSRRDLKVQQRALMAAGQDRYVTWSDSTLSLPDSTTSTAVADPGAGRMVLQLHMSLEGNAYILKDTLNNVVTSTGQVYGFDETTPFSAYFNSSRTGSITVASSSEFAFAGDFTIELEAFFQEAAAGAITSTTFYNQTGITINASGLTLTATVFGSVLTFTGTGSGAAATFGALAPSDAFGYRAKTNHIAITRTNGTVRLFLNGIMAGKTTNTTQGVASSIVLGAGMRGNIDEVMIYNGYSKWTADTTFVPARFTSPGPGGYGIPITPRSFSAGVQNFITADGLIPSAVNRFISARLSRTSPSGNFLFDQELQSPAWPFSAGIFQDAVVYHASTDKLWAFPSTEPLNGSGNVGAIWDFSTNTFTTIPKQGNMLNVMATGGAYVYKFNTVSVSNNTADFGSAINYGLTINNALARASYNGSLVLNKTVGQYARTPVIANSDLTTGDWTVELWYYNGVLQVETTPDVLISNVADHAPRFEIAVQRSATSCLSTFRAFNGFSVVTLPSLSLPAEDIGSGSWSHLAIVRSGDFIYGFTNGVKTHSYAIPTSGVDLNSTFSQCYIGCSSLLTNFARGRIQEIAIANGLAKYTGSTYTLPTRPFSAHSSASTENIVPIATYAYKDDIILCAKLGSTFTGAYRFNSSGTLLATYGFAGFEEDNSAFVGGIAHMYLGPRIDIGAGDLSTPGIETHALYGITTITQEPYLLVWDLASPSVLPSRRLRYISSGMPQLSTGNSAPTLFPATQSTTATQVLNLGPSFINDQSKWFFRNVPIRPSVSAAQVISVNFENIVTGPAIANAVDYYSDVLIGSTYSSLGLTFGAGAYATRSYLYGGHGRFGDRTPFRGGEAALSITTSSMIVDLASAIDVGISFMHASSANFTVELWSSTGGAGTLVGSITVTATGTCSLPDANNVYCTWAEVAVPASSSVRSVKFTCTPSTVLIDNLTFGSLSSEGLSDVRDINGTNVTPTYNLTPPVSAITLTPPSKSGVLTGDFTNPYFALTYDMDNPTQGRVSDVSKELLAITWYKIVHDGSQTLKLTLIQPSDITYSALQDHAVNKFCAMALYDSNGNIIQRNFSDEEMLAFIGSLKSATDITRPYAQPLVIQKSFNPGTYYISVINRTPSGDRLSEGITALEHARVANSRTELYDRGFDGGISNAIDAGKLYYPLTSKVLVNGEAWPPLETVTSYTVVTQGITAGLLAQQILTPLTGTGSIEFKLETISPSQEVATTDPLWSTNTFLLAKFENNLTDVKSHLSSGSATYSTDKRFVRFGDYALASANCSWAYTTAEAPLPDLNAGCIEMYCLVGSSATDITFTFRNVSSSQYFYLELIQNNTTAGRFKLRAVCFNTATVFDVSSSLFDLPGGSWFHLALVKQAPSGGFSNVDVCVNGVSVMTLTLSVGSGNVSTANTFALLMTGGSTLDELRVTAGSSRYTLPFIAPHYSLPTA